MRLHHFFQERFPDIEVSDFNYSEDFLDPGEYTNESLAPFTTTIGTAWSTTGLEKKLLPDISFVPKYVVDRQKIFKLEWHGFLLLLMIMVSFPILDNFRRANNTEITNLENEVSILDTQINSFTPIVNNYNRISNELSQIQDKLELLNTLSENSITWTTNLELVNKGIDEIGGVWLTSFSVGDEPNTLEIQGIARYRNRIPEVAELFADATLLNVSTSEIREQEVYLFSYSIGKIVSDESVYTPDNLKGLEDLTGN
jgi:Tfp pilus assembly protein PilN